jgi:hypothetical protein
LPPCPGKTKALISSTPVSYRNLVPPRLYLPQPWDEKRVLS